MELNKKQNKDFILRLKADDPTAFKELYIAYFDKLSFIAGKFPYSVYAPEDFVQETILRVHNKRHLLKEDIPIDWQIRIIGKNLMYNYVRRENILDQYDELPEQYLYTDDVLDLEQETTLENKIALLKSSIDALPPQQKEILVLHKIEKLSYKEIEELTGLSQKTIGNHIYLAKKNLKDALSIFVFLCLLFDF